MPEVATAFSRRGQLQEPTLEKGKWKTVILHSTTVHRHLYPRILLNSGKSELTSHFCDVVDPLQDDRDSIPYDGSSNSLCL